MGDHFGPEYAPVSSATAFNTARVANAAARLVPRARSSLPVGLLDGDPFDQNRAGVDRLDHDRNVALRRADARGNLMPDTRIAELCREIGNDTVLTNDCDFRR